MRGIRIAITALLPMLAVAAAISAAHAQTNFPTRVVKLIVPYPPGGGTDLLARVLADQLGRKWGKAVIVENIGGAGGNIGASEVFRADPDGYTLLLASPGPIATNAYMYKDMSYDPAKWVPIAVLATSPYVLVLHNGFDTPSLPLLLTHAKANPGRVTAATPGVGSVGQLATIELELLADIKLLQVPYKGLSPAVADVLAGNVDMMFDMLATSLPLYRAQKEKIIAVGGTERVKELPDVPTLAEAGVPGYRAVTFFGIVAPPGTPDALADKINRDVVACMNDPAFIEKTKALGHGSGARQPLQRGKILRRRARAVGQSDQASRRSVAVSPHDRRRSMGHLADGKWTNENILSNHDERGLCYKRPSVFRHHIGNAPNAEFPAAPSRYHLYCAVACPWAHRTTLMRTLKKLESIVTLTNTFQKPGGQGWSFGEVGHIVPGTDRRVRWLHELYTIADPACTTRVTVPTLWDTKSRRVVNDEFVRDHSDLQHGICRHCAADARLLSRAAAFRYRRNEYAGPQRRERRRQRLRLLDHAAGLRRLRQASVRDAGRPRAAAGAAALSVRRSRDRDGLAPVSEPRAFRSLLLCRLQMQHPPPGRVSKPVELPS